ncbi:hypothetical protein [Rathayibacter sp. VKM Ac-2630]|uniref:hypothetical protein n=1 Tax=Rathayibacter sp. VKM Ac-2630 TaxID=1938617 RepID=UPI0013013E94|nr:hypothetical protein [Rathayibacter sp. VKM Ac-2630]
MPDRERPGRDPRHRRATYGAIRLLSAGIPDDEAVRFAALLTGVSDILEGHPPPLAAA